MEIALLLIRNKCIYLYTIADTFRLNKKTDH